MRVGTEAHWLYIRVRNADIAGIMAVVASWVIPRLCKETYRTNKL